MKTLKKAFPIIALMLLIAGAFSPTIAAVNSPEQKPVAQASMMGGGSLAAILLISFGSANMANTSKENPAGYKVIGYYGIIDDFTALPYLTANPGTDQLATTLQGVFTAVAGKGFQTVYSTQKTMSSEDDASGEPDTSGEEGKIKFFVPGLGVDEMAFKRRVRSGKGIFIAVTREGERRVYGLEDCPCWPSSIKTINEGSIKGRRGTEYELTYETLIVPFFNGAIPLNTGTDVPALS